MNKNKDILSLAKSEYKNNDFNLKVESFDNYMDVVANMNIISINDFYNWNNKHVELIVLINSLFFNNASTVLATTCILKELFPNILKKYKDETVYIKIKFNKNIKVVSEKGEPIEEILNKLNLYVETMVIEELIRNNAKLQIETLDLLIEAAPQQNNNLMS